MSNYNQEEDINFLNEQKIKNNKKAKKYYNTHIATDKVSVYCEFCKETHTPLRLTYDKNIARNNRYICEREGGKIAGSRPKDHLKKVNPYESEGKKKCNECENVLLKEEFGVDKNKFDGLATRCKKCRRDKSKEKYKEK